MPRKSADKSKISTPTSTDADRSHVAITPKAFHDLVRKVRPHKTAIQEHVAATGGLISNAVENLHLHKKAFGWYMQLLKMDPAKRSEMLFHFDVYRERGEFDSEPDMLPDRAELDAEADAGDESTDKEKPTLAGAMAQAIDDDKKDFRPAHMRQPGAETPATPEESPPVKH